MREIKFRVWRKSTLSDVWVMATQGEPDIETFSSFAHHYLWDEKSFDNETAFLMQYTGLKDKNGVEIYEGDIVELDSTYHAFGKAIIEWIKEDVRFGAKLFSSNSNYIIDGNLDELTIIGNIYENPELLKGE